MAADVGYTIFAGAFVGGLVLGVLLSLFTGGR